MQPCLLPTAMGVRMVTNIPTHIHHHTILRIDAIGLIQPYCPTHHTMPIQLASHTVSTNWKTWWLKKGDARLDHELLCGDTTDDDEDETRR